MNDLTLVVPQQQLGEVTWTILAGWEETPGIGWGLMTVAAWETADHREMAGFGGPPLYPDSVINSWRGSSSGLPDFVLVRAHSDVSSVVAVESNGNERVIPLSEVIETFDLRFGGLPLRTGLGINELRVAMRSVRGSRTPRRVSHSARAIAPRPHALHASDPVRGATCRGPAG